MKKVEAIVTYATRAVKSACWEHAGFGRGPKRPESRGWTGIRFSDTIHEYRTGSDEEDIEVRIKRLLGRVRSTK